MNTEGMELHHWRNEENVSGAPTPIDLKKLKVFRVRKLVGGLFDDVEGQCSQSRPQGCFMRRWYLKINKIGIYRLQNS